MDERNDIMGMLDLMVPPGFCVENQIITKVNPAAQGLLLTPGTEILPLLVTGKQEYADFQSGCLYLTLSAGGMDCGASVTRVGGLDVFVLEQEEDRQEFRSMALAARELREPLTNVMVTASRLFPLSAQEENPELQEQAARLNRGLYQMLRILGNMSDAAGNRSSRQETCDIRTVMAEIFDKASALVQHTGITLSYTSPHEDILGLADREQLERAVLNILSNAVKFTPSGGTIQAELTRKGNLLSLRIQDSGSGIPDGILPSLFRRYLRQPGIEDSRFGIGLGMVLIRNAAAAHGGTVLIDQPQGCGTRVTLTMALRQNTTSQLRSPMLHVDYAGERDHCLLELSESLPAFLYEKD